VILLDDEIEATFSNSIRAYFREVAPANCERCFELARKMNVKLYFYDETRIGYRQATLHDLIALELLK
jgi:hypothetical protein